jgi:2-polyprenyl-6-methoxyphenol hydroxylase-like FAD-dependent oxidoreductase
VGGSGVLVVGAGPTGLLLASELHRRGVACDLIDERPGPQPWDRATVVHPASLEVFESMGLADRFLEAGTPQRGARLHAGGEILGEYEITDSGSTYQYNLGLSEEVTESILTDHLRALGGEVTRSARLLALIPGPDGVVAEIERDGRSSSTAWRWVVGCDGLHSVTRHAAGIGFDGHDIVGAWAVFDATLPGWSERFDLTFVYLDEVPVILTPLPDRRWRVYLRPRAADSDLVVEAASTITRYSPDVSFEEVERPMRFHCHTMLARRFRTGRLLLAGDAAHLCSPSEGHGMNTGLQDAMNLAWKLAHVERGDAHPALLDSYGAERRPVAHAVGLSGDAFDHVQTVTSRAERDRRDRSMRANLTDPVQLHHEIVAAAEMNVSYAGSPIVAGDADRGVSPGQRLPALRELAHHTGHTVMVLGGSAIGIEALTVLADSVRTASTGSPLVESVVALGAGAATSSAIGLLDAAAAERLGVDGATLLAVRPDGYVGLRADHDHLGALERYHRVVLGR